MALVFEQPVRIRWSHCDPAGIVYHPQYFVILNGLMEDFFRECTDLSYEESVKKRFGFPIVGIRSDFCVPSRHGDECVGKVWIESIGRTSVRFALTIECNGELRVQATETAVCVKADGKELEKLEIPENLRQAFEKYLSTETLPLRA